MNPYDPLTPSDVVTAADGYRIPPRGVVPTYNYNNINNNNDEDFVALQSSSAQKKLSDWGFDPDDVSKGSKDWYSSPCLRSSNIHYCVRESRPMILFSQMGDLGMMKYIVHNSRVPADELTRTDEFGLFPMYVAISKPHTQEHILTICRWLHDNGGDIQQMVGQEWSCLSRACLFGFERVAKWLLSKGALLNAQGDFDRTLAKTELPPSCVYGCEGEPTRQVADRVHRHIFQWARDIVSCQQAFWLVLSGTLFLPSCGDDGEDGGGSNGEDGSDNRRRGQRNTGAHRQVLTQPSGQEWEDIRSTDSSTLVHVHEDSVVLVAASSPLQLLNGHSGVLELMGQYVGIETNKRILCTAHGLMEHEPWWDRCEPLWMY